MDTFDKNENDNLNYSVLQKKIPFFGRNLLMLAYNGKCKKFITTFAVQKCLLDLWLNGYVNAEAFRYCRIKPDANEINFHKIDLKILASYFTFGLLAPIFLYSKSETNNDKMIYSLPEKVAKSQECCSVCHIIHETKSYSTNGLDKNH